MRQAKWETLPEDVRAVRERFETWRQTRRGRSRIPGALWVAAAQLARCHGVHPIARALGLNDLALKKHALEAAPDTAQSAPHEPALASSSPSGSHGSEASADVGAWAREQVNAPLAAAAPPNSVTHSSSPAPAFIQLPWSALAPAASPPPPRCVVELLHPGGARMTITLHDPCCAGHAPVGQSCGSGGLDLATLVQTFWSRPA